MLKKILDTSLGRLSYSIQDVNGLLEALSSSDITATKVSHKIKIEFPLLANSSRKYTYYWDQEELLIRFNNCKTVIYFYGRKKDNQDPNILHGKFRFPFYVDLQTYILWIFAICYFMFGVWNVLYSPIISVDNIIFIVGFSLLIWLVLNINRKLLRDAQSAIENIKSLNQPCK